MFMDVSALQEASVHVKVSDDLLPKRMYLGDFQDGARRRIRTPDTTARQAPAIPSRSVVIESASVVFEGSRSPAS